MTARGDRPVRKVEHLAEGPTDSPAGQDAAPRHVRDAARSAPSLALPTRVVPVRYDSLDDVSVSGHISTRVLRFHDDWIDIDLRITLDDKRKMMGTISPPPRSVEVRSPADSVPVDVTDSGDFVTDGLLRGPVTIVVSGATGCHTEWVVI